MNILKDKDTCNSLCCNLLEEDIFAVDALKGKDGLTITDITATSYPDGSKEDITTIVKGEPGKDGRDGKDGKNGEDGRDGKNGDYITRLVPWNGKRYQINYLNTDPEYIGYSQAPKEAYDLKLVDNKNKLIDKVNLLDLQNGKVDQVMSSGTVHSFEVPELLFQSPMRVYQISGLDQDNIFYPILSYRSEHNNSGNDLNFPGIQIIDELYGNVSFNIKGSKTIDIGSITTPPDNIVNQFNILQTVDKPVYKCELSKFNGSEDFVLHEGEFTILQVNATPKFNFTYYIIIMNMEGYKRIGLSGTSIANSANQNNFSDTEIFDLPYNHGSKLYPKELSPTDIVKA